MCLSVVEASICLTTGGDAYLTVPYHKEDGMEANLEIRMYSQAEARYFVKNGGRNGNSNMPVREIEAVEFEKDNQGMHDFNPIPTYPETCLMLAEIAFKKGAAVYCIYISTVLHLYIYRAASIVPAPCIYSSGSLLLPSSVHPLFLCIWHVNIYNRMKGGLKGGNLDVRSSVTDCI